MADVLLIDDSITLRQLAAFTLASAGHRVRQAGNADEGLLAASGGHFDLVICDINMPGRSGLEVVVDLRKQDRYRSTPILMLTTETSPDVRSKGKRAGASGWIVKPFHPDGLIGAINRVLF